MKTQEQKLQHVMEAAGECYHIGDKAASTGDVIYDLNHNVCKCGEVIRIGVPDSEANPSPDDLNELFRLARKLGFAHIDFRPFSCEIFISIGRRYNGEGSTDGERFLNTLFIATGGKE